MNAPRALHLGVFSAAAGLTWLLIGDSGWQGLRAAGVDAWSGRVPGGAGAAWLLAPAAVGALAAWGVSWALAAAERVEAGPPPAGVSLLGASVVVAAAVWIGDWEVAGRARAGAVLSGWVRWAWRVWGLLTVGLLLAGLASIRPKVTTTTR